MSEHEPEQEPDEAELEGLQESDLDSVTGGGDPPEPIMNLQDADPDTIEKSDQPGSYETKDSASDDRTDADSE